MKFIRILIILMALCISSAHAGDEIFKDLSRILKENSKATRASFDVHIVKFKYNSWMKEKGFDPYLSYDEESGDPSPGPAAILFFNDAVIFAVLHNGKLAKELFKSNDKVAGYFVGYLDDNENEQIDKFREIFYEIFRNAD